MADYIIFKTNCLITQKKRDLPLKNTSLTYLNGYNSSRNEAMVSFPRHIQSSWQSNWPKSNCADYPYKPGCVHVNPSALPPLTLSSAYMHYNLYWWSPSSQSYQTKFTFGGTQGPENYAASYLKTPACAFSIASFFQLSWKQALP